MEVTTLQQWYYTNTARTTQLVYDIRYQRNQNVGWDPEKKSQFLKTVMAGQSATPFVVNILRSQARLMDGGHRLQTILTFFKNEIPMDIGTSKGPSTSSFLRRTKTTSNHAWCKLWSSSISRSTKR